MDKIYKDTPYNFSEIIPYIVTDIDEVKKEIILAKRCYFYDTCSFRNHMLVPVSELIFEYIKSTSGIVIITRTIIMELCSNDGCLWREHIEYIKQMHLSGIKVVVVYEETIFEVLHTYCADIAGINKWLSYAVRCARSKVGSVETTVGQDTWLKKALFEAMECKDSKLAEKMFKAVRANKSSGDNMGEELLAICVHWLSHMRDIEPYKYVIFTDDKKAMATFGKVIKNAGEYSGSNSISIFTTPKLCYLISMNNATVHKEQIINILSGSSLDANMKVYCSEEFELSPTEKSVSIEEFAEKVIGGKTKIYY